MYESMTCFIDQQSKKENQKIFTFLETETT